MTDPSRTIDPLGDCKTVPRTLVTERAVLDALITSELGRVRPALQVVGGADFGSLFAFPEDRVMVVVGRSESCDFPLNDPSVSRHHARFSMDASEGELRVRLEDLGSTNGTQVGYVEVKSPVLLEDGDKVWIGDVELRFRLMDADDIRFQSGMQKEMEAAQRDALTGLYTRRYITDRLPSLVESHARNRVPISIALLDIDRFKDVNDTFGHVQGDGVLYVVAEAVRSCIRGADIAVRYGGEEFAIILPGAPKRVAGRIGERVRVAVQDRDFAESLELGYQITVSIGVATMGRHETIPDWIERADRALYAAKAGGRNQVRLAMAPLKAGAETANAVESTADLRAEFQRLLASETD